MNEVGTVLVTGASGFIGRATVTALRDAGWDVTETSRNKAEADSGAAIYLDLEDPASILALYEAHRFDAIVHLGARVGWSGETDSELLLPNVLATGLLAHLAETWAAYFLFCSAAIVHGARSSRIEAGSDLNPDTAYARSKWLAEQIVGCSGTQHCILRLAGVFGGDGPAHLGLNRSIADIRQGQAPIQTGAGGNLRNYIYVNDVGNAIAYALNQRLTGTHLLAGKDELSIREMLQILCDIFMPGTHPTRESGAKALDQIIVSSDALPETASFRDAIIDIREHT